MKYPVITISNRTPIKKACKMVDVSTTEKSTLLISDKNSIPLKIEKIINTKRYVFSIKKIL